VRPGTVVGGEIGSQRSSEMPSIQDHEMIQAISAYGTDEAFDIRILPGTAGPREYLFHAQ
jgi:hypothetical protein